MLCVNACYFSNELQLICALISCALFKCLFVVKSVGFFTNSQVIINWSETWYVFCFALFMKVDSEAIRIRLKEPASQAVDEISLKPYVVRNRVALTDFCGRCCVPKRLVISNILALAPVQPLSSEMG